MNTIAKLSLGVSLAALLAVAAPSASVAAEYVVLGSTGTSLTQGAVIDAAQPIDVPAGAKVTLMGADGTPVSIEGPFAGKPADRIGTATGDTKVSALSSLFQSQKKSTASLGAVRAAKSGGDYELPQPWVVSVEDEGARCIKSGSTELWRADAASSAKFSLVGGFKAIRNGDWPASNTVKMPANFFQDGKEYTATVGDNAVKLTMHVMPAELESKSPGAVLNWMAEKGCTKQAVTFASALAR